MQDILTFSLATSEPIISLRDCCLRLWKCVMGPSVLKTDNISSQSDRPGRANVETSGLGAKMLIADDDPWLLRILAERCVRMGFQVETASSGAQALLMAARWMPDVLMIDVHIPQVDGLSVCEQVSGFTAKPLRMVVITGSRAPETEHRCGSLGARYLQKSVSFWADLEVALKGMFPALAQRILRSGLRSLETVVKKQPRILFVDDDFSIMQFLTARLANCGVGVLHASGAMEACRVSYHEEPAVIVTDYFMPGGDAQFLLKRLRAIPATANIPVIVLSGRQLDDFSQLGLRREISGRPGASQILRKSSDTSELFAAVQQFCSFEQQPNAYA